MQQNFLRDHRIVPNSDPRPQTTSLGLPNVKGVDQANLAEEVGQGVDTLYHETNVPNARALLARIEQGPRTLSQVYTADNRDLALGQGGRGVVLEFDPARVNGSANANPVKQAGAAVGAGTEYTVDRSLPGAVKAIVVRNQRQADQLATNARVAARFDFANAEPTPDGLRIPYRTRPASTVTPPVASPQVAPEPTGFSAPETTAPAEETPRTTAFRAPETPTPAEETPVVAPLSPGPRPPIPSAASSPEDARSVYAMTSNGSLEQAAAQAQADMQRLQSVRNDLGGDTSPRYDNAGNPMNSAARDWDLAHQARAGATPVPSVETPVAPAGGRPISMSTPGTGRAPPTAGLSARDSTDHPGRGDLERVGQ